ncbi:transmembrane protein, putative (macronuclear) [Tetrahymena thermophila SB210]|uniref:Transmembrane protein, putative n=1 Tax=Tetrahymena thermophila (strain SB210) TaxID=312017 RepID=W7XLK3_TETTS|nr:transmembrane protein, putative [Tetrahymena thermophila SB210]EWS76439.1 transmembrane protein, putative [Tetrahymena thermophila SB210]|eukprot:XP_012651025.1 transmembrane protein, putative [Tetrahymena thermophila SB210]
MTKSNQLIFFQENQSFKGQINPEQDPSSTLSKKGLFVEKDDEISEKENFQITFNLKAVSNIMKIYQNAIEQRGNQLALDTLDFSYLTLVSTVYQNQCLSLLKILNTSQNTSIQLSWKDQQKIETIMRRAKDQIEISKKRTKKDHNQFQIYTILEQDQKIKELQRKYFECLKQYQIVIQKLSMNFIDINDIYNIMTYYREQRALLKNEMIIQIENNCNNNILKNLCVKIDLYLLHKQCLSLYQKKLNRPKGTQQKYTQFQSETSCLAYVSLLENQFGIVKNANKYFMKILGITSKSQIIGQPILSFFPQNIIQKRLYSKIVSHITEKYFPIYNEVIEIPLVLIKNNHGYSQPLNVKFQSQIINSEDFGLTICAKPILDDKIYMILDYKDPSKIKLMSKAFEQEFFSKNFNSQNQKIIKMDSFIPIITNLIKVSEKQQNKKFETLLIKHETESLIQYNLSSPNFLNTLMQSQLYSLMISFQIFNTKLASFVYMIIENYKYIDCLRDKTQYIQQYHTQIKELCGVNLNFDQQNNYEETHQKIQLKASELLLDSERMNHRQKILENNQNETNIYIQNIQDISSYNIQTQRHQDMNTTFELHDSQTNRQLQDTFQKYPQKNQPDYVISLQYQQILNQVSEQSQIFHQKMNESIFQHHNQNRNVSPQNNLYNKYDEISQISQKMNSLRQNRFENNQQYEIDEIKDQFIENSNHNMLKKRTQQESSFDLFCKNQTIFSPNQSKIEQALKQTEYSNQNLYQNNNVAFQSKQQAQNQLVQMVETTTGKQSKTFFTLHENQKQQNQDVNSVSSSTKSVQDNLQSQQENFKFINWIYMVNVQYSFALSGINTYFLNQNNMLLTPASNNQAFIQQLNDQNKLRMNLSKQYLLLLYNNTNPNIQVFNLIQNQYIPQNIYYNISHYDQYSMSVLYSMVMQTYGIYYFVSNQDTYGIVKKQNEENYLALNNQVQIIFSKMSDQYLNQLNSIQQQSLFQLFSTIFVSFFCILSIIPGYKLIKAKQQRFLELFATFDRQNLQDILSDLTYQLSFCKGFDEKNKLLESKSSLQSYVNQKDQNQLDQNVSVNIEKKLNISRTSNLNYSLKYLILGLICIFCLISIYPIVNYVLINRFIENSQLIFDFNNVVCQSYFFILNSMRVRQGLAEAFLIPSKQSISVKDLQDMLSQTNQQADQLPSLIQENIGKVGSTNLKNKDIFNNYLIKVYSENACDTMQNYTQYQNGDFIYDQCSTVGKGNLLRGLLYGVVYYISVLKEFQNFAFSDNVEEFQQKFNQYNLNTPAYKQFQFRIELSKAHEYLMNFFQDQNLQLYNFYENFAIILVVIQVFFVILVFIVCCYQMFFRIKQYQKILILCPIQDKMNDHQVKWRNIVLVIDETHTIYYNLFQIQQDAIQKFHHLDVTYYEIDFLLNFLKQVGNDREIDSIGVSRLGSALGNCTNLSNLTLYLDSNQIGDEGLSYLGAGLKKCTNLSNLYISLSKNKIGIDVKSLCSDLEQCINLSNLTLSLCQNQISDEDASDLGYCLRNCTNLQNLKLSLWENKIGTIGAQNLGSGLGKCKNLSSLTLFLMTNQIWGNWIISLMFWFRKVQQSLKFNTFSYVKIVYLFGFWN